MKVRLDKSTGRKVGYQMITGLIAVVVGLSLNSCIAYYPVSYYQAERPGMRVQYAQSPDSQAGQFYTSYFADKAAALAEDYELTDIDSYQSGSNSYAGWGENTDRVQITINQWGTGMNNPYYDFYWNPAWNMNWGWNNPLAYNNWNPRFIDPWGNWRYQTWGWNSWNLWNRSYFYGYPVYGSFVYAPNQRFYKNSRFYRVNSRRYRNERSTLRTPSYIANRGRSNRDNVRSSNLNTTATPNQRTLVNQVSRTLRTTTSDNVRRSNSYNSGRSATQRTFSRTSINRASNPVRSTNTRSSSNVRTSRPVSNSNSSSRSSSSRSSSGRSNSRGNN